MSRPSLVLVWDRGVPNKPGKKNRRPPAQAAAVEKPKGTIRIWVESNSGYLTLLGLIGAACFFFGSLYMKSGLESELRGYIDSTLTEKLEPIMKQLDDIRNDVGKLRGDLIGVQIRVGVLENVPAYRKEAAQLGIKDPQIVPVNLALSSRQQVTGEIGKEFSYHLEFTVKEVTSDHVTFLINGTVKGVTLRDNEVPVRTGVPTVLVGEEAGAAFEVSGAPEILVVVLDRPIKDTAILAVGLKETVTS